MKWLQTIWRRWTHIKKFSNLKVEPKVDSIPAAPVGLLSVSEDSALLKLNVSPEIVKGIWQKAVSLVSDSMVFGQFSHSNSSIESLDKFIGYTLACASHLL